MKRFQAIVVSGGALLAVAYFGLSARARRSQSRSGRASALYSASIGYQKPQGTVDVDDLDAPPVVTAKSRVAYPPMLIGSGITGRAQVVAILRADGSVSMIWVSSASDSRFVRYVEEAAKQWSFSVPMKGARAVGAVIECQVTISEKSSSGPAVVIPDKKPNQPPEPTALSVTPRADARVAPASTVAHL